MKKDPDPNSGARSLIQGCMLLSALMVLCLSTIAVLLSSFWKDSSGEPKVASAHPEIRHERPEAPAEPTDDLEPIPIQSPSMARISERETGHAQVAKNGDDPQRNRPLETPSEDESMKSVSGPTSPVDRVPANEAESVSAPKARNAPLTSKIAGWLGERIGGESKGDTLEKQGVESDSETNLDSRGKSQSGFSRLDSLPDPRLEIIMTVKMDSPFPGRSKPGMPFALSYTRLAGVRVPPPGNDLLYGVIPFPGASATTFAVQAPQQEGESATFYVDRNRDGDFTNDTPPSIRGTGTWRTAALMDLTLSAHGGGTYPYQVWLWTSLGNDKQKGQLAFNYYARCFRQGFLDLTRYGQDRRVEIMIPDFGNLGQFDSDGILLDWNGNRKVEVPEWLKQGASCQVNGLTIKLARIHPFGEKISLEIGRDTAQWASGADVDALLQKEPVQGNLAPEWVGTDLQGRPLRMSDYRGKVVLLDFWATWCGPCVQELPNVREVYQQYRQRGFDIVGISLDKDMGALRQFLAKENMEWRQICDQRGWLSPLVKEFRVQGIPATFLIGKDGRILGTNLVGPSLKKAVDEAMAGR